MPVNILFIGDVIGKPGREALSRELHRIIDRHTVDAVIANGENAAGGFGITAETANELLSLGVDLITTGNHVWDKKDALDFVATSDKLVRPANYPVGTPGRGGAVVATAGGVKVGVLNLEGRVFMNNIECPFRTADRELAELKKITPIVIVDFHAEATSEKMALGWYLDGKATAVIGTHTHVQTADERILPGGTAYLTDAGMTGGFDSVIGIKKEEAINRFLTQMPTRFEVAKKDIGINAVVIAADEQTGHAVGVTRLFIRCEC